MVYLLKVFNTYNKGGGCGKSGCEVPTARRVRLARPCAVRVYLKLHLL